MPPFDDALFSNICRGIRHLYKLKRLCDLTVEVGKSRFSCHRVVLASISTYFQDALEDGRDEICIQHEQVNPESFETILDILYKGNDLIKDTDTTVNILNAAVFLKMSFLKDHCEEFLCSKFDEFKKTDSFLQLPLPCLSTILSSSKLVVSNEDSLYEALLKWVAHDADQRSCHLTELLPFVRFCSLTDSYLWELHDRSFVEHNATLFEYIKESLTVKLETSERLNSVKKSRILSRQLRCTPDDHMTRFPVLIDAPHQNGKRKVNFVHFPLIETSSSKIKIEMPQPEHFGTSFASCTWRNELYVSGGSEKPEFFAVYNSGLHAWETLPDLPQGRENHAMAAINWNIYTLGGCVKQADGQKLPVAQVMAHDIKNKTWSVATNLHKAVVDATVAVLGHVIYIFGGRDVDDEVTGLVQCLNTLTRCAYLVGQLPSPTCGAYPIVNADTIYIVCSEGDVLQMKENTHCVHEHDKALGKQIKLEEGIAENGGNLTIPKQEESLVGASSDSEDEIGLIAFSEPEYEMEEKMTHTSVNAEERSKVSEHTVTFVHFADVTKRRHFSAFLKGRQIVVCGGQTDLGLLIPDVEEVDLDTREVKKSTSTLPEPSCHFGLHWLNVPDQTDRMEFRFKFRLDKLLSDNIESHRIIFHCFHWYLQCRSVQKLDGKHMEVQLCTEESAFDRNLKLNVKYALWIVPTKPESKNYCKQFPPPAVSSKPDFSFSTVPVSSPSKSGSIFSTVPVSSPSKSGSIFSTVPVSSPSKSDSIFSTVPVSSPSFNFGPSVPRTTLRTNPWLQRWIQFISIQELTNPEEGYIKHDEVTLQVTIMTS